LAYNLISKKPWGPNWPLAYWHGAKKRTLWVQPKTPLQGPRVINPSKSKEPPRNGPGGT